MSLFTELRRRNVIRVAIAYLVTAWLVAQVAELALESFGTPDWVMKTMLFLLAIGLPFALIFAWAFELTPEGIKREKDVDRTQSITHQTGRKLNYTIIGALVVALVLAIATRDIQFGASESVEQPEVVADTEKSIAVLPFVNMSDDPDNEYFSDGISEELLNVLVKVEGLRVASRTSSFSFKGKDTPIPDIADALNVEHVLEGSVRKAGDTVRITAQLIDVRTDSHLWSETYDRKLEDIFVIQDEISGHIVEALRIALGTSEIVETGREPTDDLGAYEDYLKGRYFWQRRGEENIQKAIALFEKATNADPNFARAWSSLAAAHITLPTYADDMTFEIGKQHFLLAQQHAEHALKLDSSIAEAYAVLGDVSRFREPTGFLQAAPYFQKAVSLEPKAPTGHIWYAEFLGSTGRLNEAMEHIKIAMELDPFHPGAMSVAASIAESLGELEQAKTYLESAAELGHPYAMYDLIAHLVRSGEFDAALQLTEQELRDDDVTEFRLFIDAYQDASSRDAYFAYINDVIRLPDTAFLIIDHVAFGQLDEAFELLQSFELRSNGLFVLWSHWNAPLREDPRFVMYIERGGFIEYWNAAGWPRFCSREGETITCR